MKSRTRFKKNKRGHECSNCSQPISAGDNFCSDCGQVNDLKPLNVFQFLKELLTGFFSFDTRTLNTIYSLIDRPGKVTKEYIAGKRMRYVNPFQLYLHVTIVFFLITSILSNYDSYNKDLTELKSVSKTETSTVNDNLHRPFV